MFCLVKKCVALDTLGDCFSANLVKKDCWTVFSTLCLFAITTVWQMAYTLISFAVIKKELLPPFIVKKVCFLSPFLPEFLYKLLLSPHCGSIMVKTEIHPCAILNFDPRGAAHLWVKGASVVHWTALRSYICLHSPLQENIKMTTGSHTSSSSREAQTNNRTNRLKWPTLGSCCVAMLFSSLLQAGCHGNLTPCHDCCWPMTALTVVTGLVVRHLSSSENNILWTQTKLSEQWYNVMWWAPRPDQGVHQHELSLQSASALLPTSIPKISRSAVA